MHVVMGLKKVWMGVWVGGVSAIQVFFWIFGICLTLQSPLSRIHNKKTAHLCLQSILPAVTTCCFTCHMMTTSMTSLATRPRVTPTDPERRSLRTMPTVVKCSSWTGKSDSR